MPKISAQFADVKTGFGMLPAGDYRCRVESTELDETGTNPFNLFVLVVDDPTQTEYNGQKLWHRVYMNKKDGSVNPVALGTIKSYAEAILGTEEANGDSLDTDDFVDGMVIASVAIRDYKKSDGSDGQSNDIKRISADA